MVNHCETSLQNPVSNFSDFKVYDNGPSREIEKSVGSQFPKKELRSNKIAPIFHKKVSRSAQRNPQFMEDTRSPFERTEVKVRRKKSIYLIFFKMDEIKNKNITF